MLIFICDDSRADQMRLVRNINSYAKEMRAAVTVQVFDNADAMLAEYTKRSDKPCIIFLDIYMNGTNGMDAAKQLTDLGMENGLVFTTSSEEHALQAFSVGADGYLLKPFTAEEFKRTMKRFRQLFEDSRRYITAQFNRQETRISLGSIYYAESAGHSTIFATETGIVRSSAPLSRYIGDLAGSPDFIVCGRSHIINLNAAVSFNQDNGRIGFPDGSLVVVPVRLRRDIRIKLRGKGL